jgi:FkbM family methyltransferase
MNNGNNSLGFYGQHGEDAFLANNIFQNITDGVCIEVGAYDGVSLSNTYHFEQKGWRALCIEPIDVVFNKCKQVRKECYKYCISDKDEKERTFTQFNLQGDNCGAISSLEPDERLIKSHKHLINSTSNVTVEVRSLNSLLEEINFPKNIDFISIDTENTELDVLKGLDLNVYNVKLFIIENNYNEPFCEDYLKQFGYNKFHRIAVNDFYMKTN